MRAASDSGNEAGQLLGRRAALGLLFQQLDFEHDFQRAAGFFEAARQLGGIHSLDDGKQLGRFGGFIGQEVADEVEAGRG